MSENLIRKHIDHKSINLSDEAEREVEKWKEAENNAKGRGNISIDIISSSSDLSYLSMDDLANLLDRQQQNNASLSRDAMEYKPMRNAVAHTARLTQPAKNKLTTVYENIKSRLIELLSQ